MKQKLHLKTKLKFSKVPLSLVALFLVFQKRVQQVYGNNTYFETLREGMQPARVGVLSPPVGVSNSTSYTTNNF